MFPTLFHFAGIRVATYGVLVAAGYLAGILWLHSHRDDMGMGEDEFWNVIYALFFGAIAGGKILYWIVEWRAFVSGELHPIRDFRYGFVFFGGFLGSVLAGILVRRRGASPFWRPADYFGVALPMGHSIGRLGCLAAGCCIGRPTCPGACASPLRTAWSRTPCAACRFIPRSSTRARPTRSSPGAYGRSSSG